MSRISRYMELDRRERMLFWESLLLHIYTGFLLKITPFRMVPRLFSDQRIRAAFKDEPEGIDHHPTVSSQPGEIPVLIKIATARASALSPWKNRCLVGSLSARLMLRRRKIASELSLGVTKDNKDRLIAHAWLKSGGLEIVEEGGSFTELFRF